MTARFDPFETNVLVKSLYNVRAKRWFEDIVSLQRCTSDGNSTVLYIGPETPYVGTIPGTNRHLQSMAFPDGPHLKRWSSCARRGFG